MGQSMNTNINSDTEYNSSLIIVRGGGDIASGTIAKLYNCGFSVLILEIPTPSAIRRNVAFSEAVYEKTQTLEGITCYLADDLNQAKKYLEEGKLTILVDPDAASVNELKPLAVIDAILAKKNLGTTQEMAPITIALGPGFCAGIDADAVIETMRGHNLGRIIYEGTAAPNTGVPGNIGGYDKERVIHSSATGILQNVCHITDIVKKDDVIANIKTDTGLIPVHATIDGLLRGLIRDGYPVTTGFKIADIDPRLEQLNNCFTISDKARCIAGGVLEALFFLKKEKNL